MDADRILAFRLARSKLTERRAQSLAEAAACPASDFDRGAALLALGARADGITRERYDQAVDAGELAVAHAPRAAIHALAPVDVPLLGRALVATREEELGAQLGTQVRRLAGEHGLALTDALDEVSEATADALADGRALGKSELHEELRRRVRPELMPWCRPCGSHHVAPMLWRYATVVAGARLDAQRRYLRAGGARPPSAGDAVRRFLHFYAPASPGDFADWAGVAAAHARRLWTEVADELMAVQAGRTTAWALAADAAALESPPAATGIRLLPPGDPYLQKPNRPLLAPDRELRQRLFRPVRSPGAIVSDGRLVGLWRARTRKGGTEIAVEPLRRFRRAELAEEAERVAALRGTTGATVLVE